MFIVFCPLFKWVLSYTDREWVWYLSSLVPNGPTGNVLSEKQKQKQNLKLKKNRNRNRKLETTNNKQQRQTDNRQKQKQTETETDPKQKQKQAVAIRNRTTRNRNRDKKWPTETETDTETETVLDGRCVTYSISVVISDLMSIIYSLRIIVLAIFVLALLVTVKLFSAPSWVCPLGSYSESSSCTSCTVGFFPSPAGQLYFAPYPPEVYSDLQVQSSFIKSARCPPGVYSDLQAQSSFITPSSLWPIFLCLYGPFSWRTMPIFLA